jgi:hypothetical protein
MARSSAQRTAKYTAKMQNPDRMSPVLLTQRDSMIANATVTNGEIVAIETQTRGILAGETPMKPWSVGQYLNFARSLYAKTRTVSGGTGLIEAAAVIIAKFKSQGLTESVLNKIRDEVFAIPAPTGP